MRFFIVKERFHGPTYRLMALVIGVHYPQDDTLQSVWLRMPRAHRLLLGIAHVKAGILRRWLGAVVFAFP